MDVLGRMDELRELAALSDYALCKRCNIPYSTMKAARNRGAQLSVDTIERVYSTFGVELSAFFSEEPLRIDVPNPNQLSFPIETAKGIFLHSRDNSDY